MELQLQSAASRSSRQNSTCKTHQKNFPLQPQRVGSLNVFSRESDSRITTKLPASRSSSIGPEGRFLFFHPKVKVKERISLRSTSSLKPFLVFEKTGGKGA